MTELELEDGGRGAAIDLHLTPDVAIGLVHILQAIAVAWIGHRVWRNGRKINEVQETVKNGMNGVTHGDQDIHPAVHPEATQARGVRDETRGDDDPESH